MGKKIGGKPVSDESVVLLNGRADSKRLMANSYLYFFPGFVALGLMKCYPQIFADMNPNFLFCRKMHLFGDYNNLHVTADTMISFPYFIFLYLKRA